MEFSSQLEFLTVSLKNTVSPLWMQPYLKGSHKGVFQFFGETHTDYINLLFAGGINPEQKKIVLKRGLSSLGIAQFQSRKFKAEESDTKILQEVLAEIGLHCYSIPTIFCPVASFNLEDEPAFKKIFSKSTIRNLHNRLQKQAAVEFEVIEQPCAEINDWINDFCLFHEWRWANTATPSRFINPQEKLEFKKRVGSTIKDGVSVLFSLKVDGARQSLVYSLKEGNRLIYHQIANGQDPSLYKFSLYKILIKFIGEWMREAKFNVLDFGIGGEGYKTEFATEFEPVAEIYASKQQWKVDLRHRLKRFYLANKPVQKNFLQWRQSIQVAKMQVAQLKKRGNQLIKHIAKNPVLYFNKIVALFFRQEAQFFSFTGIQNKNSVIKKLPSDYAFGEPLINDILAFYEKEMLTTPKTRATYIAINKTKGKTPFAIFNGKREIVSIGWSSVASNKDKLPSGTNPENCFVLSDFLTAKSARGKGLYPLLIQLISSNYEGATLTIFTASWNKPSQKGIIKAGFQRYF